VLRTAVSTAIFRLCIRRRFIREAGAILLYSRIRLGYVLIIYFVGNRVVRAVVREHGTEFSLPALAMCG
jgi:hypothetical protein